MHALKTFGTAAIRKLVFSAPWGVREALLDACLDRIGLTEVSVRLMKRLKLVEISADGDRGIVSSSWRDMLLLPEYAMTGTFAQTVTAALVAFFAGHPDGGTFIDIGANIGLMTIPIARNSLVHCLAFEPEPTNFDFLQRNVGRNASGGDVEFYKVALWHSREVMLLAVADKNVGDHRLTQGYFDGRDAIEVQAVPLDDFLDGIRGRVAIKMDAQGAEPHIIVGGPKAFGRADLVAIEFCPFLMRQLNGNPEIILDYLSNFKRVAVMPGGSATEPRYGSASEAQRILKEKLITATDRDGDYLDIIAMRDGSW